MAHPPYTAGVEADDWIKYIVRTNKTDEPASFWLKLTVNDASGSQVSYTLESNYTGQDIIFDGVYQVDVAVDCRPSAHANSFAFPLVVPAQLSEGDAFNPGGVTLTVNASRALGRDAVHYYGSSPSGEQQDFYWDKEKGVLLEYEFHSPQNPAPSVDSWTSSIKMDSTNMWGTGGFLGLDLGFWLIIAIVVIAVLVVSTAFFLRGRRKRIAKTVPPAQVSAC